jgi:hypothetical protein
MMEWGILVPVAAITIGPIAWVANTWARAKHGYPVDDMKGNPIVRSDPAAERKIELLSSENERQAGQITRLEERIAVLERIATDPAERTAREIDALR